MAEARLALYEETIIPLLKRTESDLNEWLAPMFGERLRIQYDIDGILPWQKDVSGFMRM